MTYEAEDSDDELFDETPTTAVSTPQRQVTETDKAKRYGEASERVAELDDAFEALQFVREEIAPCVVFRDDGLREMLFAGIRKRFKGVSAPALTKTYSQAVKAIRVASAKDKESREVAEGQEWRENLVKQMITVDGERVEGEAAVACSHNVSVYLEHHPDLTGRVAYDELRCRPIVLDRLPWDFDGRTYPRDWEDADEASLAGWLQSSADRMMVSGADVMTGVLSYTNTYRVHRLKEYLRRCRDNWDGEPRLDTWLIDYCGAEDTPLIRAKGAKWMISGVARVAEPGCQAKYILVLISEQDAGKSKALAILGGEWFTDGLKKLDQKDTELVTQTNWIIEMPELASIKGRAVEETKAFISKTHDEFRAPYGKIPIKRPRQCIFAGTTNEEHFLVDPTGNSRYWPVEVADDIDAAGLAAVRDQLWGEAVHRYEDDEVWWFDKNDPDDAALIPELRQAQADREIEDALKQKVVLHLTKERPALGEDGKPLQDWVEVKECDYVDRPEIWQGFTTTEMLDLLDVNFRTQRSGETRVGNILKGLGYRAMQDWISGERVRRYFLTDAGKAKWGMAEDGRHA